ncbi:hypothetical protein [Streptomyces sp. WAC 04229]|uniref:hypothetical protein n=1 Tax=Streptomyces sp. WAC 04229 TaxID=2203206 RepID=UPI003D75F43C
MLDADTSGCVLTWLNNDGALDPEGSRILQSCIEDLDRVIPEITDRAGIHYYQRLHRLALLVTAGLSDAE